MGFTSPSFYAAGVLECSGFAVRLLNKWGMYISVIEVKNVIEGVYEITRRVVRRARLMEA